MVGSRTDITLAPGSDNVPRAILVGAQKRSAAVRLLALLGFGRVPRLGWALGVLCDSASGGQNLVVVGAVPVSGPLPDISGHVVETVAIRRIAPYRSDAGISVFAGVLRGEMALVRVGHPLPVRAEVVAPDVRFARKSTARGKLPLGFGGQPLSCPLRIRLCILVRDLYDRVSVLAGDAAFRPGRMLPVGAMHVVPPPEVVVERNRMIGWREHD